MKRRGEGVEEPEASRFRTGSASAANPREDMWLQKNADEIKEFGVDEVSQWVMAALGAQNYAEEAQEIVARLKNEKVKGTALLLLSKDELVSGYKIARGPAHVLAAAINKLKSLEKASVDNAELLLEMKNELLRMENTVRQFASGFLQTDIRVDGEIPASLRDGTIRASSVGGKSEHAQILTNFLQAQVLRKIDDTWHPFDMPSECKPLVQNDMRTLKLEVEKDDVGLMVLEQDNQFNVKVNIVDSAQNRCHFTSRVDALVLANRKLADTKEDSIQNILQYAMLFVKVESGNKGMESAMVQLLACLTAIACVSRNQFLYGVVIDKHYSQARLVKYYSKCSFSDGMFHPSQLGKVALKLVQERP